MSFVVLAVGVLGGIALIPLLDWGALAFSCGWLLAGTIAIARMQRTR